MVSDAAVFTVLTGSMIKMNTIWMDGRRGITTDMNYEQTFQAGVPSQPMDRGLVAPGIQDPDA
ncbi:hypothetical protein T265_03084 [Opisthorchis viverrini]|uniref:Uncharacterized protein n=1 Tax=Opisthorchis viverrini TaxID=6198 RepID=A0A074ZTM5_OPIVI|nr:hypothetical protein T265_03083 [Opisthorchis viverrini]XP_009165753.1 hypothetical protein T265_03084 [Opisthorchis viverrini]KER30471.1 hypothetical protein T265_03083 [Opisthorchis viverrini]KER30472.1 hypothetical protein T265_03084 [Opisthorchis viverrini]